MATGIDFTGGPSLLRRSALTALTLAGILALASTLSASAAVDSGERTSFVPITPCRLMDTRGLPDTVGPRSAPLGPGEEYRLSVRGNAGNCSIPADAAAIVMNVVAVDATASSYISVFPADAARPRSSSLNFVAGQAPTPNSVTSKLSADGGLTFYNLSGRVNVIADVVGYFADHNHDDRYYTKAEIDQRITDTGLVGPTGPQGPAGPAGPVGPQGATGSQGPAGVQGSQGPVGPTGPTGPAGPAGAAGQAGTNGVHLIPLTGTGTPTPNGASTVWNVVYQDANLLLEMNCSDNSWGSLAWTAPSGTRAISLYTNNGTQFSRQVTDGSRSSAPNPYGRVEFLQFDVVASNGAWAYSVALDPVGLCGWSGRIIPS